MKAPGHSPVLQALEQQHRKALVVRGDEADAFAVSSQADELHEWEVVQNPEVRTL